MFDTSDDALFKLHWQSEDDHHIQESDNEDPVDYFVSPSSTTSSSLSAQLPLSPNSSSNFASTTSTNSLVSLATTSNTDTSQIGSTVQSSQESIELTPRGYQLELFERACKENIIASLETGAGKTLIAALLIKKTLEQPDENKSTPTDSTNLDSQSVSSPSATNNTESDKENAIPSPLLLPETQHITSQTSTIHDDKSNTITTSTTTSPQTFDTSSPEHSPLQKPALPVADSIFVFSKSAKLAPPASKIAVFLVHRVPLVPQQAGVIRSVLPPGIQVGAYYGEKRVDDWSSSKWARSLRTKKVLVMTAQIFLNLLRHGFLDIRNVALLVLDEVHHATKNHPYRRLFVEFYHTLPKDGPRPRVFGMTATPVKAKAASQSSGLCLKAIVGLEATLDATVMTVSNKARSEVEVLVPKPEEFVVTFKPNESLELPEGEVTSFETPSITKAMDRVARAEQLRQEEPQLQDNPNGYSEDTLERKELEMLKWLCCKLGYQAALYFATELCEVKKIAPSKELQNMLLDYGRGSIEAGGMTHRVRLLLDVLFSEYMRCKTDREATNDSNADLFRAIVFVKERISALALARLINEVFKILDCIELTARSVVGVQNSESKVRMSQSKLLETLDDFRHGHYGVLVATNVVEEGLDVPACRLVVAFDQVMSPAAYVQGRGRARKRGARYIVFLAHGNVADYNEMYMARQGAKIMSSLAEGGIDAEAERKAQKLAILEEANSREKKLSSKTTRAEVSATESQNLLHRYCVMKAATLTDNSLPTHEYQVLQLKNGKYTCRVSLHPQMKIDHGLCWEPQDTIANAKRFAALDAYSQLYELGEVDEFLLPKRPSRPKRVIHIPRSDSIVSPQQIRRKKKKPIREVPSKASKKDKRLRSCEIIHPSAVQHSPKITSSPSPEVSKADQAISLPQLPESKSAQPTNGTHREVRLPRTNSQSQKRFLYEVKVAHSTHHFPFYERSANLRFGLVIENKVLEDDLKAIRCPDGEKLISLSLLYDIPWSDKKQMKAYKYVRMVQLCLRGKCPGSPGALEIEETIYGDDPAAGFFLVPLSCCDKDDNVHIDWTSIEKLLNYGWRCGPLEEKDIIGSNTVEHSLICSYHENQERVYLSGRRDETLLASSHPKGLLNAVFQSFADYYKRKHETPLADENQVMVEGFSVLDKLSRLSTSRFMLAPETCRVVPIAPMLCYIASLLPRWQTFLALRSCWRRNSINPKQASFLSFARALQPNVNNLAKECAEYSYERLEFLGDAVLKVIFSMAAFVMNPEDDEGILSDARDVEVSNQRLADLAIEMKIHDCVAFSGVSQKAKAWPWFWGTHQKKSIQISEKVLADCVESLIGVQYIEGGMEQAARFMDRHKLLPRACEVLGICKNDGQSNGVMVPVPTYGSGDERINSGLLTEVEEIIGYKFCNKGHLVVALTHGSYRNGRTPSYQRYEYLGDAIIGFVLLSHFFHKYTNLSPGALTALRGPALSNDLFARVIVSLNLHSKFWYDCPPLTSEINKFANLIENEDDDDEDVCKTMTVPKVLGDILESIIGAIVVDKGMKLDGVQEIALRLMHAELDRFANPDRFKRNPISELVHFVQKEYNVLPEYKYYDLKSDGSMKRCSIWLNGKEIGSATGPTRRVAKHEAAVISRKNIELMDFSDVKKGEGIQRGSGDKNQVESGGDEAKPKNDNEGSDEQMECEKGGSS